MLDSIKIEGFQNHKETLIELDKYVTVLVGPNDAGKSAAIRAFLWVCLNEPHKGSDFINWESDRAKVTLRFDNKHKLVRGKGKGGNYYSLNGKKLRAFRKDVPEQVSKLLRISPLNFQHQHDPLFLLSASSGQISRELNAVIDLESIDFLLSDVASELRELRSVENVSKKRLHAAKQEVKSLQWAVGVKEAWLEVEKAQKKAAAVAKECDVLSTCIEEYRQLEEDRRELRTVVKSGQVMIEVVDHVLTELGYVKGHIVELQNLIRNYKQLREYQCEVKKKKEALERKLHKELRSGNCPICGRKIQ